METSLLEPPITRDSAAVHGVTKDQTRLGNATATTSQAMPLIWPSLLANNRHKPTLEEHGKGLHQAVERGGRVTGDSPGGWLPVVG